MTLAAPALALASLLAGAAPALPRVPVALLGREAPRALAVRGAGTARSLAAREDTLLVDGAPAPRLLLPRGTWRLEVPGQPARTYAAAALAFTAARGAVVVRAEVDLEAYVAAVVASETVPGTPPAALAAQAVVVRSYALSARDRHAGGALCDLAHCQVLRGAGIAGGHLDAARRAARATEGEVLLLLSGEVAQATFHAACGGHTADPREAFGAGGAGGLAGPDPGCEGPAWSASLPPERLAAAVRGALADPRAAAAVAGRLTARDLVLTPGQGGWVSRVAAEDGGWRLSGDAFARAVDGALGRGRVRSSRFTLADRGGAVVLRGSGHGHGVGLCQAGAARAARRGEDPRAILSRFFRAQVGALRPSADTLPRAREERRPGRGRARVSPGSGTPAPGLARPLNPG